MSKIFAKSTKHIRLLAVVLTVALSTLLSSGFQSCTKTDPPTQPSGDTTIVSTKVGGITLALVPAGSYMQGADRVIYDPKINPGWKVEFPQRKVTITRSMYVSQSEITEGQWKAIMKDSSAYVNGVNYPKIAITWYEAIRFCNVLSTTEGLQPCYEINGPEQRDGFNVTWNRNATGYRLPTSAEWQYACRAGSRTDTYNGNISNFDNGLKKVLDSTLDAIAWYYSNSGEKVHEIKQKKPNSWKLYDMLGNASEWAFDCFKEQADSIAVTDPIDYDSIYKFFRAVKGGDCQDRAFSTRSSANESVLEAMGYSKGSGLRVVRNK